MNVGGASSSDLDIEFSFTGADLRINPNANVWMRTVFNQEYIDAQNAMAWESDKKLSTHMSASVGRMMNDYRDFVMGSNPSVSHINFGNLMDLTTLVKGEMDNEVDLSANRFIVWSELSATMDRMLKLLANLDDDFNKEAFIKYLDQIIDPYLDEYYPDKVPNQEGSYLKKKARTSPYIVNMALATQNVNFLTQSDDLIKPVKENVLNDPIFNTDSVFDVKYYEFSPDNRDATFQAALLQNNDYSAVIMQAIIEEVSYDGKLMPKPIDGRDIYICVSSFGVWDDCLAQKYVKFLSYASTYVEARNRLNELYSIDQRLAKQLAVELARHNWLRNLIAEELQDYNFNIGNVPLDGIEATDVARATCANAWTIRDEELALKWAQTEMSDSRWNGNAITEYCLTQISSNRNYLSAHYPSMKEWICTRENDTNCMDDLPF